MFLFKRTYAGRRSLRKLAAPIGGIGLVAALLAGGPQTIALGQSAQATSVAGTCDQTASTPVPQPTTAQLAAAGLGGLPVAPEAARVDLVAPPFSNPTNITNPLFPISELASAVLNGHVDGTPFRTETTLLPETRIIEWVDGQCVEVLVSQYTAYLGGRLEEVALDYYAQADDGSVWYFGEDVFNYDENGRIRHTDGTWLAGKEGPAAMIMPASPQVGDVNRPENIPGLVFEEVTTTSIDETMGGPSGPVAGIMIGQELHDDGSFSDKAFAPGYGEFRSAHEGDLEALALAAPTDALPGPVPTELEALSTGADRMFSSRLSTKAHWKAASKRVGEMVAEWDSFRTGDVPPRLVAPTNRALKKLGSSVEARDRVRVRGAAVEVSIASTDLQLRYRPPTEIDLARFELWARRVQVHARARDLGGVGGDVATMEWIRDRFVHTLDVVDVTTIDTLLGALRTSVVDEDLQAAAGSARELRTLLAGLV